MNAEIAAQIGTFLVMLVFLFKFHGQLEAFKKSVRGDGEKRDIVNQPFVISRHPEHVSVKSFDDHKAENDNDHERIHDRIDEREKESTLHAQRIAVVEERSEKTDHQLTMMDGKLDRLIERFKA